MEGNAPAYLDCLPMRAGPGANAEVRKGGLGNAINGKPPAQTGEVGGGWWLSKEADCDSVDDGASENHLDIRELRLSEMQQHSDRRTKIARPAPATSVPRSTIKP